VNLLNDGFLNQILKMTLEWIFVEQCFPAKRTENAQLVFFLCFFFLSLSFSLSP
jgi:hypothetical protein